MGPAGSAESLGGYRALFRRALLAALAQGAPLAVARSRAALATWDVSGAASHEEAERARVEEFAAFLEERGEAHPTREGTAPSYGDPVPVEDDGEPEVHEREGGGARVPRVPRPRPLPGDRIRRGGSR